LTATRRKLLDVLALHSLSPLLNGVFVGFRSLHQHNITRNFMRARDALPIRTEWIRSAEHRVEGDYRTMNFL
jgi:hypothetical protein